MLFLFQAVAPLPPSIPLHATFIEMAGPWYKMPDWWVAIGTVVLAIVTGILARYTYKLFQAAQEAHKDSQKAIAAAETNAASARISADAAVKSMELTLRAYVVVSEIRVTSSIPRNPSIPLGIKILLANVGQTPALNSMFICDAGVETLPYEVQSTIYSPDANIQQLKGTIGHSQMTEVQVVMNNSFMSSMSRDCRLAESNCCSEALLNISTSLAIRKGKLRSTIFGIRFTASFGR